MSIVMSYKSNIHILLISIFTPHKEIIYDAYSILYKEWEYVNNTINR